jgi:hypothetical protein
MGVIMNYESRFLAGVLLIVLPTVMIGGVSILSLLIGDPTYLEGVYKVKEGDLVVISSTSRARRSPPRHYVLLVDQEGMTDLTGPDFATSDGTFKATQQDGEIHFDLGSQKRKKKSAIYKNGTITVDIRSPEPEASLPKKECAAILNMVVKCVRLPECNEGRIFDNFAMAAQRYFNRLEEMPVFTSRNFYGVCTTVCTSKSYVAKQARSILCGY